MVLRVQKVRRACVAALVLMVATLALPARAAAQETPSFGLMVSSPGDVGFLWRVTDRIAIRPSLSFRWVSFDTSIDIDPELLAAFSGTGLTLYAPDISESLSTMSVNLSVGVQFTLSEQDRLRLYVAPEFGRVFAGNDDPLSDILGESESSNYQIAGLFGAQYALSDRFALFGETGVQFSHASSQSPALLELFGGRSTSTINSVGSASRVGLVLKF